MIATLRDGLGKERFVAESGWFKRTACCGRSECSGDEHRNVSVNACGSYTTAKTASTKHWDFRDSRPLHNRQFRNGLHSGSLPLPGGLLNDLIAGAGRHALIRLIVDIVRQKADAAVGVGCMDSTRMPAPVVLDMDKVLTGLIVTVEDSQG